MSHEDKRPLRERRTGARLQESDSLALAYGDHLLWKLRDLGNQAGPILKLPPEHRIHPAETHRL